MASIIGESDSEAETVAESIELKKNKKRGKKRKPVKRRVRFSEDIEIHNFPSLCRLGPDAPKSQTNRRIKPIRPNDIEKKVLSQRGRARSDVEMRMAVGRGKLIERIVRDDRPSRDLPSIEVKIHEDEWLIGTMNPDDLT